MTIEEKAGQLFQTMIFQGPLNEEGFLGTNGNSSNSMIGDKHMTHFNLLGDIVNATETA
jgi:hypothetical protein